MTDPGGRIGHLRRDYVARSLIESSAADDPLRQFGTWFEEAVEAELVDANAMTLATVSSNLTPAARIVLLKSFDEAGFVFFTNYESAKGQALAAHPGCCLLFFWAALERQVRITGTAVQISTAESDAYFATRPRDSQLGAWTSHQSQAVDGRQTLEARFEETRARFGDGPVPRPPFWGGFRVAPLRMEFWQGRHGRLHDRLLYTRTPDGWTRVRLEP